MTRHNSVFGRDYVLRFVSAPARQANEHSFVEKLYTQFCVGRVAQVVVAEQDGRAKYVWSQQIRT